MAPGGRVVFESSIVFSAAFVGACATSTIACLAAFFSLCKRRHRMQGNLFWMQLLMLTSVDCACFALGLAWGLIIIVDASMPELMCEAIVTLRMYSEFLSTALELHIAAGFAVSCCGNVRALSALFRTLSLCVVCPAILVGAVQAWRTEEYDHDKCRPGGQNWIWSAVVLSSCCLAAFAYIYGAVRVARRPYLVRRRVRLRGLAYVLCFLLTFGPRSILDVEGGHAPLAVEIVITTLFNLNGATNAAIYYFFMWRKQVIARESLDSTLFAAEDVMIDSYFDLYITDVVDEVAYNARRSAAVAVAEARQLRDEAEADETG